MSKALLQIGFLSFFVAAVIFGLQSFSLFDTIGRAFIVFVSVIIVGTIVLTLASWISITRKGDETEASAETPAHSAAGNKN